MPEILQIKIAPEHDAPHDDLNRITNGYFEGMPPELAWERGRGVWVLSPAHVRRVSEVEIVGGPADVVLAVAQVEDLQEFHGKYALVGAVIADHPRIGKPSPHPHPSRNRINYYRPEHSWPRRGGPGPGRPRRR